MAASQEQTQLLAVLEDTATVLRKTQVNLKKCSKSRITKGYIEARIKIIQDYWNTFKKAHIELVRITPKELKGTLPYFLNEEFFIYEDLYNVLYGDLSDMLLAITEPSTSQPRSTNSSFDVGNTQSNISQLPKIQLPIFSGSYEAWPAFHDLFVSLVHSNTYLTEVQKLHYLKSSVTAEAENLLRHITITASNYNHAWEVLKARYGNKKVILNATMKRLFNQKKLNSQSSVHIKNLLDTTTECLNTLENLEVATSSWDPIIIYLVVQKMDPETHKDWEEHAYKEESEALPTWNELKKFLESKFRTLELINTPSRETTNRIKERTYHVATLKEKECIMCQDNHTLCHCKKFTSMEPANRNEFVKNKQLCYNCLVPGHPVSKCKLPLSCRICRRRHHSLLHVNMNTDAAASSSTSQPQVSTHVVEEEEIQVNTMISSQSNTSQRIALLATAIVEATNEYGHTIPLRALIDQGSQATFISEKATQSLKLKRQPVKGSVTGVGSTRAKITHVVQLQIRSHWDQSSNFRLPIQAYVMSKQLTAKIPTNTLATQTWPHIKGLKLADPSYLKSGSIDLLLGVKEYTQILEDGFIRGPPGGPSTQKTSLGWILFGEIYSKPETNNLLVMHHQIDMEDMLKSIWEIDVDNKRHFTIEEQLCENIYKTTTRNKEGRYIVKLPFKTDSPLSPNGNLKDIATQRFLQLERKLKRTPDLKIEYTKVINGYLEEGHMEKVPETEREGKSVYLPHHAVIRNDKESTRTRVVFDASCKGSNNVSLNDELLVDPQLQDDLRNLLIRWRMKHVCFVADIQQMYRQILVTKDDADYQRILWRSNESENLEEYRLLRVTFGTAPAPYLAVKTLHQVAHDEGYDHSRAVQTIKEDFYMDDLLSGADSVEDAVKLSREISDILKKGGFQLTKWSSNNIEFMKSIDENKKSANAQIDLNLDGTIKTLGIVWNLKTDKFQYNISLPATNKSITKRGILSDLQKLFDPLGWIAPSTVMAKMLIQKLWVEKVDWDERVSETLEEEWKRIRSDLIHINDIQIERWFGTLSENKEDVQIHGFCDASMCAYGAVVYIRTETAKKIETNLIAARTRVAPLKTISLPRLELCGALLLSKLMKQVGEAMRIPTSQMYAWTDSSIVIAWLCGEPNRWKPFVANRVVEIVENLNNKHWYHIQSPENPADLTSRGMLLSELKNCRLWWKGPRCLSEKEINISKQEIVQTELEKRTTKINTYLNTLKLENEEEKPLISQFEDFDNLTQLLKTIICCKRFLNSKTELTDISKDMTKNELEESLNICIRKVQEQEYKEEIERIKLKKQVKRKSQLRSLNPYLDENNILRVGGRLRHRDSPEIKNIKILTLSRWQHTQKLSRLQQRPKWLKREKEFKIGDIVIIKTDLPPGKWALGRVVDKHPGADGFTRVYSIKSSGSVIKRSITKLCALPIDYN